MLLALVASPKSLDRNVVNNNNNYCCPRKIFSVHCGLERCGLDHRTTGLTNYCLDVDGFLRVGNGVLLVVVVPTTYVLSFL